MDSMMGLPSFSSCGGANILFPLFGLFAAAGNYFSAPKSWQEHPAKAGRENTLDSGEEDFPGSPLRRLAGIGKGWDCRLLLQQNSSPGGRTAEWGGNAGIEKGGCPAGRKGNGKV